VVDSFPDAARRHWSDAKHLATNHRFQNVGHLLGFAAECLAKEILESAGIKIDSSSGLREHFPKLRDRIRMNGHSRAMVLPLRANEDETPAAVSPEISGPPRRRTFTVQDKLRILAETDRAADTGGIGAILRREGLYSSTLGDWRRLREAGVIGALVPGKRGPKAPEPNPLTAEMARLQRNNAHLTRRLVRAEAIIDIQKKVAALLGIPLAPNGEEP
jgi:transposase-like protein